AYMQYSMQDGKTVNGGTAQYNFAASSNAQTLKVTIPEDYQESTYTLSLGSLCVTGFGDPYGGHRSITLENGKDPNFNASIREAYLGQLPDITIPVTLDKTVTSIEIATPPTKTAYYEGDSFDPSGMVIAATYSDGNKNENVTSYTVSPAA